MDSFIFRIQASNVINVKVILSFIREETPFFYTSFLSKFSWCSGYHICLTHRRSPVRSRAKTVLPRGLTARISGFHPGGPGSTPGVGILFIVQTNFLLLLTICSANECHTDEVAEWLRRWTANPMGSARVGSNPILVVLFSPKTGETFNNNQKFPLPGIEPGPPG